MNDSAALKNDSQPAPRRTASPAFYLIWGAVILLIAILGWGLLDSNATRPEAGTAAADFDMTFFNGYEWESKPVANLSEMEGKVVVLNFWAAWCVECRLEADLLQAASEKYADDVIFLGIAWTDTEPKSMAYLQEFGITYPNAPDLGTDIGQEYEITGVPETFFIDKNGTIAQVIVGPVNEVALDTILPQLISQ